MKAAITLPVMYLLHQHGNTQEKELYHVPSDELYMYVSKLFSGMIQEF